MRDVRANVYVDGFSLYYAALKGTPYKWLNLRRLSRLLLPRDRIHRELKRAFDPDGGFNPGRLSPGLCP